MRAVHLQAASLLLLLGHTAAEPVKDLNTPRTFPKIESKEQWKTRAEEIRHQVLVSCGLWPMPPKGELNARIFDRVERDGYSIEKAYFQSTPCFYVAGNLYRPLGKGPGPFPAVLNPHGHWRNGRMADEELGSIAARCISFARQGMVAFSYDMVGYNDTRQVDHKFASNPTNQLWNLSLMGLQTWNSIRALDFLETLPDVDAKKLACTGESGGGTQTFMLGAIDDRLAAQGPIVMVSHTMQGGCLCENAPGLRLHYSNIEIAAAAAPRPQVIVAATGDWTRKTMEMEGPAIQSVYRLLGAPDNFNHTIFNYDHNYNKTTREYVYQQFGKWLLNEPDASKLKERDYKKEPDEALRVFPGDKWPEDACGEQELIHSIVSFFQWQLEELRPTDKRSLENFKKEMTPLWEHALQIHELEDLKEPGDFCTVTNGEKVGPILVTDASIQADAGVTAKFASAKIQFTSADNAPDQFKNYYTTYNRTVMQRNAARAKQALMKLRAQFPGRKLVLFAPAGANPALVFAAPAADGLAADLRQIEESDDQALLAPRIFFPGYRRLGGVQSVLALAAPKPLLLSGGNDVPLEWLDPLYEGLAQEKRLRASAKLDAGDLAEWIENQF